MSLELGEIPAGVLPATSHAALRPPRLPLTSPCVTPGTPRLSGGPQVTGSSLLEYGSRAVGSATLFPILATQP